VTKQEVAAQKAYDKASVKWLNASEAVRYQLKALFEALKTKEAARAEYEVAARHLAEFDR
jgi:hypothetical protein